MKRTLSFVVALLCCIATQAKVFISDLYVATGSTEAEAKQAMTAAGYTVINRNVNQNGGGKYVYIGFKATTKKNEALADVVIVPQTGSKPLPSNLPIAGKVYKKASYNADAGNLNAGRTGADVLYLYISTTGNSSATTPVIDGVFVESSASLLTKAEYAGLYSSGTIISSADLNAGGTATEHHYLKTSKHTCTVNFNKTATTHSGTCSECGYTFVTENHTFAWRDNNGYCQQYCTTCNYVNANENHDQAGFAPISDDNTGWHYITCSKCGVVVTSAPHQLSYTESEDDDSHLGSCSKCHWEGPIAHSYGEYKENKTTNKHQAICSVCKHVKSQDHDFSKYQASNNYYHETVCSVCNAVGQSYSHTKVVDIAAVPATCSTPGSTEAWHCSDCNYSMARQTTTALGHLMTSVPYKEKTCYEPGNNAYFHCERCKLDYRNGSGGQVVTQDWIIIPAKHNSTPDYHEATAASCTQNGNLENWYCPDCSNYFTSRTLSEDSRTTAEALLLPLTGHDFTDNNGFCLACQANEPAHLNEEDDTYEISNGGQLYWFAEQCNAGAGKSARLVADVRVNARVLGEDGKHDASLQSLKSWTPIKNFADTFDGCGHTISGLYFYSTTATYTATRAGLFHQLMGTARILNTTLADSYLSSYWGAAGFASESYKGCYIYNCHNKAHVYASYNGAAGIAEGEATVENCTNQGYVEANTNASGIGGKYVTSCANMGEVTARTQVAGITYSMPAEGYVKNSYNTGTVKNTFVATYYSDKAFAICYAPYSNTVIANCYALEGDPNLTLEKKGATVAFKTAQEFRSGAVCSLLNANHPAGTNVWRQNIYVDKVPMLQGPEVSYDEAKQRYVNQGVPKSVSILTNRIADLSTDDFTLPEVDGLIDTILER